MMKYWFYNALSDPSFCCAEVKESYIIMHLIQYFSSYLIDNNLDFPQPFAKIHVFRLICSLFIQHMHNSLSYPILRICLIIQVSFYINSIRIWIIYINKNSNFFILYRYVLYVSFSLCTWSYTITNDLFFFL